MQLNGLAKASRVFLLKKEPKRKEILDYLKKLREAGEPMPIWATITRSAGSLCYKPVKKV
jgi:hypothetical protein